MTNDKLEIFNQSGQVPAQVPSQVAPESPANIFTVKLPSLGKCYGLDHPLCNCQEVEVRYMRTYEEDLLNSPTLLKNGKVFDELINSCLVNKAVRSENLLLGDRNALLVHVRINNLGTDYQIDKIECPLCEEKFTYTFDLNGMQMRVLDDVSPVSPNTNLFKFTLPKSKAEVKFRLLTGAIQQEIEEIRKNRKKNLPMPSSVENLVSDSLCHQVQEVILPGGVFINPAEFIMQKLSVKDSRALRSYINSIEPDIIMKRNMKCIHCGETSEVAVPMTIGFFWNF